MFKTIIYFFLFAFAFAGESSTGLHTVGTFNYNGPCGVAHTSFDALLFHQNIYVSPLNHAVAIKYGTPVVFYYHFSPKMNFVDSGEHSGNWNSAFSVTITWAPFITQTFSTSCSLYAGSGCTVTYTYKLTYSHWINTAASVSSSQTYYTYTYGFSGTRYTNYYTDTCNGFLDSNSGASPIPHLVSVPFFYTREPILINDLAPSYAVNFTYVVDTSTGVNKILPTGGTNIISFDIHAIFFDNVLIFLLDEQVNPVIPGNKLTCTTPANLYPGPTYNINTQQSVSTSTCTITVTHPGTWNLVLRLNQNNGAVQGYSYYTTVITGTDSSVYSIRTRNPTNSGIHPVVQ